MDTFCRGVDVYSASWKGVCNVNESEAILTSIDKTSAILYPMQWIITW